MDFEGRAGAEHQVRMWLFNRVYAANKERMHSAFSGFTAHDSLASSFQLARRIYLISGSMETLLPAIYLDRTRNHPAQRGLVV